MKVTLVAAMTKDGVIGKDNGLPWPRQPDDMKHFVSVTAGKAIVMGRNTWNSLPKRPLQNRLNIVIDRAGGGAQLINGQVVYFIKSYKAAELIANDHDLDLVCIGGKKTYELFADRADEMILTYIEGEYEGDCNFPEFEWDEWALAEEFELKRNKVAVYQRLI